MKDRNLPIPKGYTDYRDLDLFDEYKQFIRGTLDIYTMYKVGRKIPKEIFINKLREIIM